MTTVTKTFKDNATMVAHFKEELPLDWAAFITERGDFTTLPDGSVTVVVGFCPDCIDDELAACLARRKSERLA